MGTALNIFILTLLMTPICFASAGDGVKKIKITVGDQVAIATLYDTPAANDLIAQLPLNIILNDFASKEKIYVLPKKLHTSSRSSSSGDVAYYIPWGNLALFYDQTMKPDNDLLILGKFDSGRNILNVPGNVNARIEFVK